MSKKTYIIIFFFILFVAFIIRIYDLSRNPPGFFCDEAAIGYNAYTLLHTGKDEYGVPHPILFRSFGDYRLPIPIYSNIISVALFGLHDESIRLTTIIYGLFSIAFMGLIARKLFGEKTALAAMFLLVVTPWHIQMSRWGSEYMYFLALFSMGFYFFIRSLEDLRYLLLSSGIFGLAMYTYYPSLFVTPLFLAEILLLSIIKWKKKALLFVIGSIVVFALLCIPLFQGVTSGELMTRWNSVDTTHTSVQQKIQKFSLTYLDHFKLDFLFLKGDVGMPGHFINRHSVKGWGELYPFELPLIIIGFILLFGYKNRYAFLAILGILLLYPLGSSVTNDGVYATRSVIGLLPLTLLAGEGLGWFWQRIEKLGNTIVKTTFYFIITCLILLSVSLFMQTFYGQYISISEDFWGWQYGPKPIMQYFLTQKNKYDDLYMTGFFNAPEIFLKFYDPQHSCPNCSIGGIDRIDLKRKQLFAFRIEETSNLPYHFNLKKTIYYPDGKPAFYVGEFHL